MLACAIGSREGMEAVRTCAQTQNLDVVSSLGPGQGQDGRSKEHGLIVGVGNEQANALVPHGREARLHDADGVHVQNRNHHHQGRQKTEGTVHAGGRGLVVIC